MLNNPTEILDLSPIGDSRRSLWDIIQQIPNSHLPCGNTETEPDTPPQEQPIVAPALYEARELPEMKLFNQLNEVTRLLEQQTSILIAQQKLLEDLTARQKQSGKRKPGMAKKLKSLIHKGKFIWSVL